MSMSQLRHSLHENRIHLGWGLLWFFVRASSPWLGARPCPSSASAPTFSFPLFRVVFHKFVVHFLFRFRRRLPTAASTPWAAWFTSLSFLVKLLLLKAPNASSKQPNDDNDGDGEANQPKNEWYATFVAISSRIWLWLSTYLSSWPSVVVRLVILIILKHCFVIVVPTSLFPPVRDVFSSTAQLIILHGDPSVSAVRILAK